MINIPSKTPIIQLNAVQKIYQGATVQQVALRPIDLSILGRQPSHHWLRERTPGAQEAVWA